MPANIYTPGSVSELLCTRDEKKSAQLVAGATDWMVKNKWKPVDIIDMSGVRDLKGILSFGNEHIFVGALETMSAVSQSELLRTHALCLCEAASGVGSWQIRNRATLGGNLANASPAADTPCALAALAAKVELVSSKGTRLVSVEEAIDAFKSQTREIISKFIIPIVNNRTSAFRKLGTREQVSIARLNLAASISKLDNTISNASIFVGTLGNSASRCKEAEAVLTSQTPSLEAFCETLSLFVDKKIPNRETRPYKRSAIKALGEEVFSACLNTTM